MFPVTTGTVKAQGEGEANKERFKVSCRPAIGTNWHSEYKITNFVKQVAPVCSHKLRNDHKVSVVGAFVDDSSQLFQGSIRSCRGRRPDKSSIHVSKGEPFQGVRMIGSSVTQCCTQSLKDGSRANAKRCKGTWYKVA